jgi:hypothetical protein
LFTAVSVAEAPEQIVIEATETEGGGFTVRLAEALTEAAPLLTVTE